MRKRFLSVIMILTLTFGTCGTALAADTIGGTRDALKSYGKIAYQNGSDVVVIDSGDFHMLADRLDLFKQRMADQLQAMHTYFTAGDGISLQTDADIHVVHTKPSDENTVDPLKVNFDTLLEGFAASQSVSSDVTDYGYPAETELYKNAAGVLTTDGSEEGAEKISVTAATADNLSAGTAAWVNGRLILGTGEDNQSCFESGYVKGNAEAGSQIASIDFIKYGGNLTPTEDIGPIDITIPNKDVAVILPGPLACRIPIGYWAPKPDAYIQASSYDMLSILYYKKDPTLPEDTMRMLHLGATGAKSSSGINAFWFYAYLN